MWKPPIRVVFHSDREEYEVTITSTTHFKDVRPALARWRKAAPESITIVIEKNQRLGIPGDEETIADYVSGARFLVPCSGDHLSLPAHFPM
jgi:hypothetical protein